MKIFTIGHSTHKKENFLQILNFFNIELIVDVRSFPGSKYMPHFNKEQMQIWLKEGNIEYLHLSKLGGRRRTLPQIDNKLIEGWKHIAFKNYAAYTLTEDFKKGLEELIQIAKDKKTCIMCAESVPWKCHRLLISNCLHAKGVQVFHILQKDKAIKHKLNLFGAKAVKKDGAIIYPK